jgi:hypothetical protein
MTREKSTEEQVVRIDAIVGDEALGYKGEGREEHSGEKVRDDGDDTDIGHDIADNRPDQIA